MSNESRMKPLKHEATQPEVFRKGGEAEGGKWLETRGGAWKSTRGATMPEKVLIYISRRQLLLT